MKWFALAFAAAWLLSKFYERASFALAVWINHLFRHDGKDATVPPTTSAPDVTESMRAGSPFAVDASNGPCNIEVLTDADRDDIRKLAALVEFHRVTVSQPMPPSRSNRRSIH